MGRSTIAAGAAIGGVAIAIAAWIGITASQTAPARWEPASCAGATDSPPLDGLIAGVVRLPDCRLAAGATVYVDAWFHSMGETDDEHETDILVATRDEQGAWRWRERGPAERHVPFSTRTDAEGRFAFAEGAELRELLGRREHVMAWATYGEWVSPKVVMRFERWPVRLPTLVLGPSTRPSVRLVTLDRDPVVDAYVELAFSVPGASRDEERRLYYSVGARTDDHGVAHVTAIPWRPDWEVVLRVNPRRMPRFADEHVALERLKGSDPATFHVSRGFTLRGRVVLPDGSPGADVRISSRGDKDPNPNSGHATTTREDGSFELPGVPTVDATVVFVRRERAGPPPPGTIRFATDHAPARLTRRIRGREGEVVDLGTIALPATRSIAGIVLDPSGKPAVDGSVLLDDVGHSRNLGPDGRFEIEGVEPGQHSLTVTIDEDPGHGTHELVATVEGVEAGAKDVVIRVSGGGNLVVRFHAVGRPDEPLEVRAPALRGGGRGTFPDSKATEIRFDSEPGWHRELRVDAEGYKTKMLGPVEILRDRKTVVDVELEPKD